jgi:hypothetical protein
MPSSRNVIICVGLALLATSVAAPAADNARGAVELSTGGKVPQNPALPQLQLNNAQREKIREAVLTRHTEVEFKLKSTKAAKDFTPKVGAALPKGISPDGLPQDLIAELPQLRDYAYVKMKDEVLIVDAQTRKIVDVFSETQPLS